MAAGSYEGMVSGGLIESFLISPCLVSFTDALSFALRREEINE